MTEPQRYKYRYTTEEQHEDGTGVVVIHTRQTVGWDNLDTLITRGIDRYGWRDVDYWEVDALGQPVDSPNTSEHRTGRKLPDGSWEPAAYSDWTDANPAPIPQPFGPQTAEEYAEDNGPYCYCGHTEDRHGQGEDGNECWGCRDDEYAEAPMTHDYEEAS